MTDADAGEFEVLWRKHLASLIRVLVGSGARYQDAEDAAQEAFIEVYKRWSDIEEAPAYLRRTAHNMWNRLAARPRRDFELALRGADRWVDLDRAEDVYHGLDAGVVDELLARLTARQREVVMRLYENLTVKQVADALKVDPVTIRAHLRDARDRLSAEGIDRSLPLYIRRSWARARICGVVPDDPTTSEPLPSDEVRARRVESPFWGACAWARDWLNEVAHGAGQMAVIVDHDGVVLWRDGAHDVIEVADRIGFSPGSEWTEAKVGCTAIGVSLATGDAAEVLSRWHQRCDQRSLNCYSVAIQHPVEDRLIGALNLTEHSRSHRNSALDKITTTAGQIQRQLAAASAP